MAKISKKIGFSLEWHSKNYKDVNILFFAALTLNFSIYTLLYIRIIFVILYACHFFKHINNFNYISYEIKTIVFLLYVTWLYRIERPDKQSERLPQKQDK